MSENKPSRASWLFSPILRILNHDHYPELDGLRGVAILLVLYFHCRRIDNPSTAWESHYYTFLDTGWVGVDLFFVLSGFLITGFLLSTVKQERYFGRFYTRRALRIFPLYYPMLILVSLASLLGWTVAGQPSWIELISYWVYLQNWLVPGALHPIEPLGHFWSLAVEEQFYLLWPVLILLAASRNAVGWLCGLTIAISAIARIGLVAAGVQGVYFCTVSHMDALAAGAGLAYLSQIQGSLSRCHRTAIAVGTLSAIAVLVVGITQKGFYGHDAVVLKFGLLPLALLFASLLVLAYTSRANGFWRRVLRNRWLRVVGTVSYGIYIVHYPMILLLQEIWPYAHGNFWLDQLTFLPAVTAGSLMIAWASFRYLEKPILDLKLRFAPSSAACA